MQSEVVSCVSVDTDYDIAALRDYFRPGGTYAVECGRGVESLRKDLHITRERLAAECGVTATTIRSIEGGLLLPRDYLRAAIALTLGKDVTDLWPPPRRARLYEMAAPAA